MAISDKTLNLFCCFFLNSSWVSETLEVTTLYCFTVRSLSRPHSRMWPALVTTTFSISEVVAYKSFNCSSLFYGNTYTIVHVRLSGVEYYSVFSFFIIHARNFESAECVNVVWDWLCDICRGIVINNEENPAKIIINFPDVTKTEPNNPVLASSVLREINKFTLAGNIFC